MGRQRGQLDLSGRCAMVLLKSGNGLRFAIFEDFEIFLLQTGNRFPFSLGDHNIYQQQPDFGIDCGYGVTGVSSRSLRIERCHRQKQKHTKEAEVAAWIHTSLLEPETLSQRTRLFWTLLDSDPTDNRTHLIQRLGR